jgi:ornithine carbamoyltransferase
MRHFLSTSDWSRQDLDGLFELAIRLKREHRERGASDLLRGRLLALVFHKPSLRTRVSFEAAMAQMGGSAAYITDAEIGLGTRETVEDVARVLSRYVDAIMIRTFAHANAEGLAAHATVPVINGLTDRLHPCQIGADLLTIIEAGRRLDGLKLAWIGDGNNVAHSWIEATLAYAIDLRLAVPEGYDPDPAIVERARREGKGRVTITRDPKEAAAGADVLYTDVWASMGQEKEREKRLRDFKGFQIDAALLRRAAADALVLHCLPAHRGEEITNEVIEGPQSRVFDEAENRLHFEKALVARLIAGI